MYTLPCLPLTNFGIVFSAVTLINVSRRGTMKISAGSAGSKHNCNDAKIGEGSKAIISSTQKVTPSEINI